MKRLLLSCTVLFALALPCLSQVTRRNIPEAEAQRMLKAPVRVDARAGAVLRRSAQAYAKLKTLLTESNAGRVKTVTRLKRPRYYHSVQHQPNGEMISLAISDGKTYWDYQEPTRKYLQRDAAVLPALTLPLNARPFFVDPSKGRVMRSVKGSQTVREYAFAHAGDEKLAGKTADRIRVSTLVSSRSGWRSYDSFYSFDRKTGLLLQVRSGSRSITIKNTPNADLPTKGFVWKPIPDSTRSFE